MNHITDNQVKNTMKKTNNLAANRAGKPSAAKAGRVENANLPDASVGKNPKAHFAAFHSAAYPRWFVESELEERILEDAEKLGLSVRKCRPRNRAQAVRAIYALADAVEEALSNGCCPSEDEAHHMWIDIENLSTLAAMRTEWPTAADWSFETNERVEIANKRDKVLAVITSEEFDTFSP